MGSANRKAVATLLTLMSVCVAVAMGTVYRVGDSAGWTTIGNIDYDRWASTKTFHVGDTIFKKTAKPPMFEYHTQFHNVMQVSHSDYRSCNTTTPVKTYSTGKDSIAIWAPGHYYFLCGFPGHCQAGQKVDIRVPKSSRPAASPSPGPARNEPIAPSAAPVENGGPSVIRSNWSFTTVLGLSIVELAFCASGFAF
ncbi:hypothetical protein RJ640_019757 [Escallonia rubra]|uniref:Phytocyanin domain-containing protein n=1 Tax=Escallonia rubra TaxID=112253 RepID=A0AA88U9G3_9ASTE|nr:hypothetical protein RJ640_019757 [Escallonia rubra]